MKKVVLKITWLLFHAQEVDQIEARPDGETFKEILHKIKQDNQIYQIRLQEI